MEKAKFLDTPIKILGGTILLIEIILTGILTLSDLSATDRTWIIIGMIGSLFLTILGALFIHWVNNGKSETKLPDASRSEDFDFDVFIAFAIAGEKNKTDRSKLNKLANDLEAALKKIGYNRIFNASQHFSNEHDYQPPKIAAETDIKAISRSKCFLLLYPSKVATSALIELGYALAGNKKIVLCSNDNNTLPFLARGFSEAFPNVNYLEYNDEDHLINMITKNHDKYLKL